MSKKYKKKIVKDEEDLEIDLNEEEGLSKKELYDLNKKKKEEEKKKKIKKETKKKKIKKQPKNFGAKIFAIFMFILMIGSVIVTVASYIQR